MYVSGSALWKPVLKDFLRFTGKHLWWWPFFSEVTEYVFPKCRFVFLINWNTKLEIKSWLSFLYWIWDRKHQNKWFSVFQKNWTLKFKFEVWFSFLILIWKTQNQIYLNKYLMKLVIIPLTQSCWINIKASNSFNYQISNFRK